MMGNISEIYEKKCPGHKIFLFTYQPWWQRVTSHSLILMIFISSLTCFCKIATPFSSSSYKLPASKAWSFTCFYLNVLNIGKFCRKGRKKLFSANICSKSTIEALEKRYEICSKLTIKATERRQRWRAL